MWRFIQGISRGFRPRTPAPPSQTITHDDNENAACSQSSISSEGAEYIQSSDSLRLTLHSSSASPEGSSCEIRSKQPSEADILLREVFGDSWKNSRYGAGKESNQNDFTFFEMERIRTGLTLGTAGMTILVVGRGIFSSWQRKCKRREILRSRLPVPQDYGQRCLSQIVNGPLQTPRLAMLPSSFSAPFSPASLLAAGGDSPSCGTSRPTKNPEPSSLYETSPTTFCHSVDGVNRKIPKQKSVTFDENIPRKTKPKDFDESEISEDQSFSDEALNQFTEETRECSGATFNILGLQSTKSSNYKQAIDYFKLGCDEGHAGSFFNLGLCYERGLGTRKSMKKAVKMYERASDKGHTQAQYNLAVVLMKREGLADKTYAIRLLEKAALKGLVKAQSYLGVIYTEQGHFQNFNKAVKMFKMAAESGDASSKFHLGVCYERGLGGLKKDPARAFDLYSSAAVANHLDAQYNMAAMLETGIPGAEKNPQLARELFQSGAEAGHKPSRSRLKQLDGRTSRSKDVQPSMFNVYYSHGSAKPPVSLGRAYQKSNEANISPEVRRDKDFIPAAIKSAEVSGFLSGNISASGMINSDLLFNNTSSNLSYPFYQQMEFIDIIQDTHVNPSNSGLILGMRRSFTTPAGLSLQNVILKAPSAIYSSEV